jgi:HEAT repeat protein
MQTIRSCAKMPRPTRFVRLVGVAIATAAALAAIPAAAADGRSPKEKELIAVLRSDAAEAAKAIACKGLAVHGSADAVPDLAKLLGNERLASWARIALESIPDPACDEALRAAADSLSGLRLVGVLNSIGVRRDTAAVDLLVRKLADTDADVAAAAAAALGNLPGKPATERLTRAFVDGPVAVRPTVAEACVVAAERMLAAGDSAGAIALYDLVRNADVPRPRILEATRGAILARAAAGVPLLVDQLRSTEADRFALGLGTARELRVPEVDAALAAEVPRASPPRAALLIEALADRGGPAALPVIVATATHAPNEPRLAALRALGRVGDRSCLDLLLKTSVDGDANLAAAARAAVRDLPGAGVDEEIRRRIGGAAGPSLALLLDVAGHRRLDVTSDAMRAADNEDEAVRTAALRVLGATVDLERLPVLVQRAVKPRSAAEEAVALSSLRAACVRMPDRDACVARLAEAMAGLPAGKRVALLDIVGEVAGPKALALVVAAARDPNADIQDASTRLLGKWPTPDAAADLLALAESLPPGKFRTRAFRGYLRIVRQFTFTDAERLAMCRKAFAAAQDADDKKAVIEAGSRTATVGMLVLLAEAGRDPELRSEARKAADAILPKIPNAGPDVRKLAAVVGVPPQSPDTAPKTGAAGGVSFTKTRLTEKFHAEGAGIGDIDRDGHGDAVYGPYWYAGPDFKARHEIYPPHDYDPSGYSENFITFVSDIDGDEWLDVLVCGFPGKEAFWYRNPGRSKVAWRQHLAFPVVDNESPTFGDLTGDGRPELVFHTGGILGFAGPSDSSGTERWPFKACSAPGKWQKYTHGLGYGDVNGDGRADLLMAEGWWEQPAKPSAEPWKHHPFAFGGGGAQMHTMDVDGDGDRDVITSLQAHGYGVAWFEQVRKDGGIGFVQHAILPPVAGENLDGVQFSQPHAVAVVDVDGDGLQDVVTGKRFWAHGPKGDPDPNGPALLYWFQLVRDKGRSGADAVRWVPHKIDDDSGIGTQFAVGDIDGDRRVDIVIGNKKGGFVFRTANAPR